MGTFTYSVRPVAINGTWQFGEAGGNHITLVELGGVQGVTGAAGTSGTSGFSIPAWTSVGAISIGGTTTAPTKPTTRIQDNISYRQIGAKEWEVVMSYLCTNATGAVGGSGDFLFTLPNSLQFDTTLPSQQIWTGNIQSSVWTHYNYIIPSSSGLITNNGVGGNTYAMIYNSTQFRILGSTINSGVQAWGSAFFAITGYVGLQLTFRFTST